MIADHQRLRIGQVESRAHPADGQLKSPRSARSRYRRRPPLEPFDLGLVVAGDQDPVTSRGTIELDLDLRQFPGEAFDTLDPEVAGRFRGSQPPARGEGDRWLLEQAARACCPPCRAARVVRPAKVVSAFLLRSWGLDQGDPGIRRKILGDMAEAGRVVTVERRRDGERHRVPTVERALSLEVERADRLDIISEKLDPNRFGGVG